MMLTTGVLLAQRYRLGRRIAVGGMGEVWEGIDTRLDRQVAVKVLKPELSGDGEFLHRFRAEARTTASLSHPGIAAVHDYGEIRIDDTGRGPAPSSSSTAFLVMELVAGESLATVLARHGRLSQDRTLDILEQAGHALQAAHERGLVHRDVKPGNILLTPNGIVKLTDFGIAKAVDAAPMTRAGIVMGTAHYIAPEQAAGSDAGPSSDVYALGVVGYECLAGQRPFRADSAVTVAMMHIRDTPPPLPPDVGHGARALIEAALVKDSQQRYATGGEFATAVAAVRAGRPLPLPAGMGDATAVLSGGYPTAAPTPTALLPPGALTGPQPGPHTRAYRAAGYPTGSQTRGYAAPLERRSGSRAAVWVLAAVLLVAALVLGGYGLREALRSDATPPGTGDPPPAGGQPPPAEPPAEEPAEEPAPQQPAPQQPAPEQPDTVTVEETDYLGDTSDEVAAELEELGLVPHVVDDDGAEVDPAQQQDCLVTDIDPSGAVERGETVTVTCVRVPG